MLAKIAVLTVPRLLLSGLQQLPNTQVRQHRYPGSCGSSLSALLLWQTQAPTLTPTVVP